MTKDNPKIEFILNNLAKLPPNVLDTAYLYATNLTSYGVDVTKSWTTAVEQMEALHKAYDQGKADALEQRLVNKPWISIHDQLPEQDIEVLATNGKHVCIAWIGGNNRWYCGDNTPVNVLAWIPLPDPAIGE